MRVKKKKEEERTEADRCEKQTRSSRLKPWSGGVDAGGRGRKGEKTRGQTLPLMADSPFAEMKKKQSQRRDIQKTGTPTSGMGGRRLTLYILHLLNEYPFLPNYIVYSAKIETMSWILIPMPTIVRSKPNANPI